MIPTDVSEKAGESVIHSICLRFLILPSFLEIYQILPKIVSGIAEASWARTKYVHAVMQNKEVVINLITLTCDLMQTLALSYYWTWIDLMASMALRLWNITP